MYYYQSKQGVRKSNNICQRFSGFHHEGRKSKEAWLFSCLPKCWFGVACRTNFKAGNINTEPVAVPVEHVNIADEDSQIVPEIAPDQVVLPNLPCEAETCERRISRIVVIGNQTSK